MAGETTQRAQIQVSVTKPASSRKLDHVVNIADLRAMAKRRVPKAVFDYLDGGAEGEVTLRENCRAFEDLIFRPKSAVRLDQVDLRTTVLGHSVAFPAILAPVGYSRLMHPGGECAAAQAAGEAGTGYILSTISGHKLEDVKAATSGFAFYQLYLMGGRDAAMGAIERARNAGFAALVITVDTAVSGSRERDPRNGMKELLGNNPFAMLPFLPNILAHPGWLISFLLDGGVPPLHNVVIPGKGPLPLTDVAAVLAKSTVAWEDLKWIREVWTGPIIAKGIMIGDDARRAIDAGASAVVVSNHGGRQLDCCDATIRILPEVVEAVHGQIEVLMDGGIRRGGDIVKALCLGAKAVLIGRGYAYGLAAAGHAGVTKALQILCADVDRTMRLLGVASVAELNSSYVKYLPSTRNG